MVDKVEPTYTDLVYDVLRTSDHPLTFPEIFDAVNQRRAITTKNPKATIRNALSQGKQLISLGDGHYGYLPHLIQRSVLRLPLTEKKPANHPLLFPNELRHALWPSFFESQKREHREPAQLRLPSGAEVSLSLGGIKEGNWGSPMPETLRRHLVENYAAAGDSLLIRVTNAEGPRGEIWLEPQRARDTTAVARRNREVADAVEQMIRRDRSDQKRIWEIVIGLLARGFYHSDVAPDPVETILKSDRRFAGGGWFAWMLSEKVTPEVEAQNKRSKELLDEILGTRQKIAPSAEERPSIQGMRRAMERSTADIGALLSKQGFASMDDANAYLQNALAKGGVPHRVAETPLEQAQNLMYDAWETPRRDDRIHLARQALQISSDCADAYVLLAEETAHGAREALDLYQSGVAAGERALGEEVFSDDVGHFWGIVQTRPYMRARFGLAQALWSTGKRQEAIEHLWDLLRLNPGDNQGVRYALLSWLLERGDSAQVTKLLDMFPDDAMAAWLYARALQAFHDEGNSPRSRTLLADAIKQNPHVPGYLIGKKRFPRTLPETMGWGDETEAIHAAAEQMMAWRKTQGAVAWLSEHRR